MKIFISWSGELSHQVAIALRDWLPSVIQTITPYVSSEDIDKGARWSSDIASELDQSAFGILCVTKENVSAPWLNFEAGALGKSIDKSKVCPFLFRIKRSEVEGPILQYQSTIYNKKDALKLLYSINEACADEGISEQQLEKAFDVWWPELQNNLDSIDNITPLKKTISDSNNNLSEDDYLSGILEELLEISRTNQKLLRDPESILPEKYLEYIINSSNKSSRKSRKQEALVDLGAFEDFVLRYKTLRHFISNVETNKIDSEFFNELNKMIRRVDDPLRYMTNRLNKRLQIDINLDNDLSL